MGSALDRVGWDKGILPVRQMAAALFVCVSLSIGRPALAEELAGRPPAVTEIATTVEQPAGVDSRPPVLRRFRRLRTIDNAPPPAPGPTQITVGSAVSAAASITVGTAPGAAQVTIGTAVGPGQISISRAGDALGSPVDFTSFMQRPGLSGLLPTGLPLASARLTSQFGLRAHPILGGFRNHAGVDLAAPYGSPIYATSDGTVSAAGWQGGYGLLVALDHGGGLQTRYGHMSRLNVAAGQRVRKHDVIGYIGSTGLSTGPHVHYEVRVNGAPVNPYANRRGQ